MEPNTCKTHYQEPTRESCKEVMRDRFFDALFGNCLQANSADKNHIVWVYQWAWQYQNGTRTYFNKFWSATNRTGKGDWGCNCKWRSNAEAWKCNYCDFEGEATMVGGPLGPENHLYYCGGLTLAKCQVPTKSLYHFPPLPPFFSTGQRGERK